MNTPKFVTKLIVCFAVWLIFAFIGLTVGLNIFDYSKYHRLSTEGITVYGQVVSKDQDNHQSVQYSFKVEEQIYTNSGSAGRGNPSFADLNIGDKVVVFYDRNNPNESF